MDNNIENNRQEQLEQENKSLDIAEMMNKVWGQQKSPDAEILDTVTKFSLQILPTQQKLLNRLLLLSLDKEVPDSEKIKITRFIEDYMSSKRYHDSLPFIGQAVEALSLRRFWSQESMKGNIVKQG